MGDNIIKTIDFIKEQFNMSEYMSRNPKDKKYRLEHTIRIANIGKEIAMKESLNEESLIIGCLLHDISYIDEFRTEKDWLDHGRNAAKIARPFLETLELSSGQVDEICYGIAIHVDDESDFTGERTALAKSIGDCDNIDRFDAFRIYEGLEYKSFSGLSYEEQMEYVAVVLEKLNKYKDMELATKTGTDMWVDKITFQTQFFERLRSQLESSYSIV
ncbi:HD domain-containing protein [Tissierella sp.]|uniref:HD domain-containing protein n=1 Tax=Tissierella sp. TaxID=41274 RepID=UPI00285A3936|nr:HD domain-containing protein [Tissierella sp.]MDR7856658.1 HD domain-containing protein [Tissierella sp.]